MRPQTCEISVGGVDGKKRRRRIALALGEEGEGVRAFWAGNEA